MNIIERKRELIKFIFDANANINKVDFYDDIENENRILLLGIAGIKDNFDNTALMHASSNGYNELVKLLIEFGVDVNAKNNDGRTALMMAVRSDKIETVKTLINAGAKVNIKDDDGETALSMAYEFSDEEMEDLLTSSGAVSETRFS